MSSHDVVAAHLDRIDAINPAVNALRVVMGDAALAAADEADRRLAAGEPCGPLHGVPVSVKENVDVEGTATTWGVKAMLDAIAPLDAPVVASLRRAGAIPVARGNMPDFALRWHTDSGVAGATRNPWNAERTPGGSSGGEAVALATGMVPLAVGSDLGGSLRVPSQFNGTAALRPSHGRLPDATTIPPTESPLSIQLFDVRGPMARSVADLRIAFEAMIAPTGRDPWHVPAPPEGPPLPRRASLAIPDGTDPGIAVGVRRAAQALAEAGYDIDEALPPRLDDAARLWIELLNEDLRRLWPMIEPVASEGARRFLAHTLQVTPPLDAGGAAARWQERQAVARAWSMQMAERPLIVAPVCLRPPFAPDGDLAGVEAAAALLDSLRIVLPVNLLGLPAVALPVGVGEDGMPLGVQVIGPRFREDACLAAAGAIEAALGTVAPIEPRGA